MPDVNCDLAMLDCSTVSLHPGYQLLLREDTSVHLNRLLATDKYDGFMSMFYCRVDPVNRSLTYASAGHPGYLLRSSGETSVLAPAGVALGAVEDAVIVTVATVVLNEGDLVFLPTDGVYETTNPAGAMFGIERTVATVREHSQQPAIEIVQTLYQAARGFSEGAQQQDDITAVVIKATG